MAVSAGGYDTAKRDSILSVITGAHMPKKKVNGGIGGVVLAMN